MVKCNPVSQSNAGCSTDGVGKLREWSVLPREDQRNFCSGGDGHNESGKMCSGRAHLMEKGGQAGEQGARG